MPTRTRALARDDPRRLLTLPTLPPVLLFVPAWAVAGRVHSKRGQGKLMFYDIHGEGVKIQIMSDISSYEGGEDAFREVHNLVKRGDIVGVRGFPGKSKKGELSIFPQSMQLLSPCLHMLPKGHTGLKNQEVRALPAPHPTLFHPS